MPFTKKRERSPSSTPLPSTEAAAASNDSSLPSELFSSFSDVLNHAYTYRTLDGLDPSKLFHKKVNKRVIPEYYDTIKEPVALSTIKAKIMRKEYQNAREFVRDFALIPHNAQVFNRPDSGAFQDALVIKAQLEKQLQLLVEKGTITKEDAVLPYLGEIPTYEDVLMEDAGEAEEESSDEEGEEDDDEEGEELDDEGKPVKKKRGPKGPRDPSKRQTEGQPEKKARGRPPKLLTPVEARIQAIIKGIRKPKNQRGQLMIKDFDRLPDKTAMPEYYLEIKNPIAYDVLKKKVKRKKYRSVEEFMADVNLMFNNAKEYNQDDSAVYKHATALQIEAGRLYDIERAKPDDTFADDEGKLPMPDGILHNGQLYKVGDWVHIQNPNDLTKPIPAQIYRTYKGSSGQNMVNVCWYYRPEQTVHRFDKHFFPDEVVKTGRYRDHNIEEIEGKCFIMFLTRYFKGRPRGLPEGQEIYVCEARYNETAHQFNKIKTWASCLPDEVRDKDYEMDMFDHARKMKKVSSPIAYLLKDEQKETDDLPKVQWGAEGAPPKIGAVHRRPRGDRDSIPPEPTPPPPPKQPTPPPRPMMPSQPSYNYTPSQSQTQPRPVSRAPLTSYTGSHPNQYTHATAPSPIARPPSAVQQNSYHQTPQTPQAAPSTLPRPTAQPSNSYSHQSSAAPATATPSIPPNPTTYRPTTSGSYRDPAPIEVYILPDQANLSIPAEVREQYQRDEQGRVLFFTAPPVAPAAAADGAVGGHSIRYLAEKARRKEVLARKRKERDEAELVRDRRTKVARLESSISTAKIAETMKARTLRMLEIQLVETGMELDGLDLQRLGLVQRASVETMGDLAEHEARREGRERVRLRGTGVFGDDYDCRLIA
ncbi:hypothetical protein LTR78_002940 [Recurvomyces mirabilis]|uniref:Uncharacterized protein n=1 Tax=Recurvomyces mirabilis TaxID=574656 RepID=A0AAE0WTA7_9PEZI|nr:hypothetical protein LTR78_002940 [Recurvomyces mirabilis]KAK5159326.1 hypothetical protein LTS14_002468 [Recurvomyces mirabilis]